MYFARLRIIFQLDVYFLPNTLGRILEHFCIDIESPIATILNKRLFIRDSIQNPTNRYHPFVFHCLLEYLLQYINRDGYERINANNLNYFCKFMHL